MEDCKGSVLILLSDIHLTRQRPADNDCPLAKSHVCMFMCIYSVFTFHLLIHICVGALPACTSVYHEHAWGSQRSEKGVGWSSSCL